MKDKKDKRPSAMRATAIRICALSLGLWLLCMLLITGAVTQLYMHLLRNEEKSWSQHDLSNSPVARMAKEEFDDEIRVEQRMMETLTSAQRMGSSSFGRFYDEPRIPVLPGNPVRWETAAAFFDPEGNPICIGRDFYRFYYTEDTGEYTRSLFTFMEAENLPDTPELKGALEQYGSELRLTGRWDGAEFVPERIEEKRKVEKKTVWVSLYEAPGGVSEDAIRLIPNAGQYIYAGSGADLRERLLEVGRMAAEPRISYYNTGAFNGVSAWEMTFFHSGVYFDQEDEIAFYLVLAHRVHPLAAVLRELLGVYIGSFLIFALGTWLLLRGLRKQFFQPIALVYTGMTDGWGYVAASIEKQKSSWREPRAIQAYYMQTQSRQRQDTNEIARLNAALDYAREAEESRRQLTSDLAHELKTPLAVIHSYTEGLQERIAEEKRDKYLSVIQSETERMDGMVLEMLDLSRLEAGRVKLARDIFDLGKLAREIFGKLEEAAEARELTIHYELSEPCMVNLDEARIGQVVENFATNALRYTTHGGDIWVRARQKHGYTTFAMENTAPPLSEEMLEKVWERFWRAEEARSEKSSGLGLAIAKTIVELHGGTCSVRNTEGGVEFSFRV